MNTNMDAPASDKSDIIKWGVAVALILASVVMFHLLEGQLFAIRVALVLVAVGVAVFIASKTEKGRFVWNFLREAHVEVRKVVWPSNQETVQTTGIVLLMVVVVALFVWILDATLFWIVRLLTGQGG
ncbi:preprotein translocase subunit SecE [Beggiatoa leptomitoformis]|uniref:Protein translocase subunit SecE n=1 Tax=Beggiatoa leptomitoformis TaxID=288004 RepID=A0A2N9YHW5_9GAMM|nr:preprotein translocase subunit SecE [Beggiatoa leptomitoformis]ALG67923.1 preprotein translocase subunit SecE [Beggiatoa leptomitoformis]AUI69806.1 preprotein translocase subunit SecE [Beggiatoa leptomitoformis]